MDSSSIRNTDKLVWAFPGEQALKDNEAIARYIANKIFDNRNPLMLQHLKDFINVIFEGLVNYGISIGLTMQCDKKVRAEVKLTKQYFCKVHKTLVHVMAVPLKDKKVFFYCEQCNEILHNKEITLKEI